MNTCCICGKETGNDPQALIVNGEERQICDECAAVLDVAETADPASQGRINAVKDLKERLKTGAAPAEVCVAVEEIINPADMKVIEQEIKEELIREKEEEEDEGPQRSSIESLTHFLSVFAIVFLVAGILTCLIVGGILAGHYETSATGWFMIIGGSLIVILTFAVILLALAVAEAIGRIDQRMENVESILEKLQKTSKAAPKAPARKAPAPKTTAPKTTTPKTTTPKIPAGKTMKS
jgi:hypothetical protein